MQVTHNWTSPRPEWWIEYNARQSAPKNREKMLTGELTPGALLKKCIDEGHWSPFEHAVMSLEVTCSMFVAMQVLRHGKGFSFQQFSQRYANPFDSGLEFEPIELRLQSKKNRQSSTDPVADEVAQSFQERIKALQDASAELYCDMLDSDIARENARGALLMSIQTRFTWTGPARSFMTYFMQRLKPDTQKEHRDMALQANTFFVRDFPIISSIYGWTGGAA